MDQHSATTLLELGIAQCAAFAGSGGGLAATLFMAGLVGGWTHCAGMCGPFVLAQVGARLERVPASRMGEWHRLTGAAVLPYHLGRATTYAAIGAVAAAAAGSAASLPGLRWISAALLAFAALFFLGFAFRRTSLHLPGTVRWSGFVSRLARPLFSSPVGWRGYGLGMALGFVPCGLLYGAVAVAAAGGSPAAGALGMAAFSAGTLPSLFAVGLAGHLAGRRAGALLPRVATAVMMLNALVLGYMAWRLAFSG